MISEHQCQGTLTSSHVKNIRIRITVEYNGINIPEDVLDVLAAVRMLRSFRAACRMLGVNPAHMTIRIR